MFLLCIVSHLPIVIKGFVSSVCNHAFSTVIVPDEENVFLRVLSSSQHDVSESGFVVQFRHKVGDHRVSFVRPDCKV